MGDPVFDQEFNHQQQVQAGNTMFGASQLSPAAGATALAAGPKVGVPPDTAVFTPDVVAAQAKTQADQQAITSSPPLAGYLAGAGPATAAAAKADMSGLADIGNQAYKFFNGAGEMDRLSQTFGVNWKQMQIDAQRAVIGPNGQVNPKGLQYNAVGSAIKDLFSATIGNVVNQTEREAVQALGLQYIPEAQTQLGDIKSPFQKLSAAQVAGFGQDASLETRTERWTNRINTMLGLAAPELKVPAVPGAAAEASTAAEGTSGLLTGPKEVSAEPSPFTNDAPHYANGTFATTEDGKLATASGEPVQFASPEVAQSWVDELGNRGPHGDIYQAEGSTVARLGEISPPIEGVPPVGAHPGVDTIRDALAVSDAADIEKLQETVAGSPALKQSPELMQEYLKHVAYSDVHVDAGEMFNILHDHLADGNALPTTISHGDVLDIQNLAMQGQSWDIPLGKYLSITAGQSWAGVLNAASVFRGDGKSVNQAQEPTVPSPAAHSFAPAPADTELSPHGQQALAATDGLVQQSIFQAETAQHLKQLFSTPQTLGMSKPQFNEYSKQTELAQQQAYDATVAKVAKEIKKYSTKEFKTSYENHYPQVVDDIMAQPAVQALYSMKYGAEREVDPKEFVQAKDGSGPATFYHGSNYTNIQPGEWTIPKQSSHKGVSFAEQPQFASKWAQGKHTTEYTDPGKELRHLVYIVHIKAKSVGDFRNPDHVAKAANWFMANRYNHYGYAKGSSAWQDKYDQVYKDLAHGDWSLWEQPDMWKPFGWDAVRMVEHYSTQKDSPNIFTATPENIFFKFIDAISGEEVKLDPSVKAAYPQLKLPKGIFKEGGYTADQAANLFGFDNGEEFLKEISAVDASTEGLSLKNHLAKQFKAVAQQRAEDEVGIRLSPEQIQQMAKDSVASPKVTDLLIAELQLLADFADIPFDKAAIQSYAENKFESFSVKKALNIQAFEKFVYNGGTEAERALLKADYIKAFKYKQIQYINHLQLKMAHSFAKLNRKTLKSWGTWAKRETMPNVEQKYLNYVHAELMEIGYKVNRDLEELLNNMGGVSLETFVQLHNAYQPTLMVGHLGQGDPMDWSVHLFRTTEASLKSLMHNGREAQTIKNGETAQALMDVVNDITRRAATLPQKFSPVQVRDIANQKGFTSLLSGKAVRELDAIQLSGETFLSWMDNAKSGPMQNLVNEIEAGGYKEADYHKMLAKEFADLRKELPKKYDKTLEVGISTPPDFWVESQPWMTTRGMVVAAALNMGNASSFDKLTRGYGWDPVKLVAYVDSMLSDADRTFIRGIWAIYAKLWPDIAAQGMRMTGVAPPRVKPQQYLKGLPGGYYPVVWERALIGKDNGPQDPAAMGVDSIFGKDFIAAVPPHPYMEERTNFAAPISLEFKTLASRLDQVVHALSYMEPILNANKVLSQNRVKRAIQETLGPELLAQIFPWLQYIARRRVTNDSSTSALTNGLRRLRSTSVFVAVGYRLTTVFLHSPIAAIHSLGEAGLGDFAAAGVDFFKSPDEFKRLVQFVNDHSPEVRQAWEGQERDVRLILDKITTASEGRARAFEEYGFKLMTITSQLSSYPLWLAVYKKSLTEVPGDKERAIGLANKSVRITHGAGRASDIPAYMRETGTVLGEFGALFTTLMSFLNSAYNRGWTARMRAARLVGGGYGGGGSPPSPPPDGTDASSSADEPGSTPAEDTAWLANYLLFFIAFPAVWYAFRHKTMHPQTKPLDDLLLGLAENTIGTMPGGREFVRILENLKHPETSQNTAAQVVTSFSKTVYNAWIATEHLAGQDRAHQVDKHWFRDAANTLSYLPGPVKIPGQFVQSLEYLASRHPPHQTPADVARGLMQGKTK
jgi:hypothetical protein